MRKKEGKLKMATQMAETPTLYGKDAEAVMKQVESKPSKSEVEQLKKKLEQKFEGIQTRRG